MNNLKKKYLELDNNSRTAFWAILIFAVITTVVILAAMLDDIADTSLFWHARIAIATPIFLAVVSFIGAYIILMGRPNRGGNLFMGALTITTLAIVSAFSGIAFAAAALALVLCSYIGLQILPLRSRIWAPAYGLLVGASTLLGDAYIPWERASMGTGSAQTWIAIVVLALYGFALARQFGSFELRTKLVFISLFLTVVPVALLGVMSSTNATAALEKGANESLLSSASQVASSVDSFILNNLDTVRVESQMPDFSEYLELPAEVRAGSVVETRVTNLLRFLRQRDDIYILSYALLDNAGFVVAETTEENKGDFQSNQMYFIEAMNTGLPYVSSVQINVNTSDSVIIFSAPVRNALGGTVGVLRLTYKADILQQQLVKQGSAKGVNNILVDDNFILLANYENPQLVRKSILPLDESRLIVLQRLGVLPQAPIAELSHNLPDLADGLKNIETQPNFIGEFHTEENPDQQFGADHVDQAGAVRTKTRPWYVISTQSRDQLLAPVETLQHGVTVLGVVTAFVGIILSGVISSLVARPIMDLSEVATRLAEGDLSARAVVTTDDEVGMLGHAFNNMSKQLSGLIGSLEQRVSERTRALATSTEVSRHLSTILDENQLVKEVVEQLQAAFDYYHVHIYLLDAAQEKLVMVGGTGEAGQTMLERKHQISRGRGLVGRAAETGVPILVADVSKADGWLPNPLLPYTRAEMAVPILAGEQVVGVLDVQDDEVGGLQQSDADLLQAIANQVGVGLLNARSYKETQRRAQREAMVAAIGQRILQTTSTQEALQVAVREVGRALGAPNTTVRLNVKPENGHDEAPEAKAGHNGHGNDRG